MLILALCDIQHIDAHDSIHDIVNRVTHLKKNIYFSISKPDLQEGHQRNEKHVAAESSLVDRGSRKGLRSSSSKLSSGSKTPGGKYEELVSHLDFQLLSCGEWQFWFASAHSNFLI